MSKKFNVQRFYIRTNTKGAGYLSNETAEARQKAMTTIPEWFEEHPYMVGVTVDIGSGHTYQNTDLAFNPDGSIKGIYSTLEPEQVKTLLCQMVDEHYKRYGVDK
jgi:hypothetical protein